MDNGMINNVEQLRQQLTSEGHHFVSEMDTEVIPQLIEKYCYDNLEVCVTSASAKVGEDRKNCSV